MLCIFNRKADAQSCDDCGGTLTIKKSNKNVMYICNKCGRRMGICLPPKGEVKDERL